jgi:outer membrane protein TolC
MRRNLSRILVAACLFLSQSVAYADSPDSEPASPSERINLRAAVDRAVLNNPTSAVAKAQIERAEALVRQARSFSLPTLTGNGQYTRLDGDRMLGDRVASAADQLSANLTLSVNLVAPQRWVQWSHASEAVEVASISAEDLRRLVAVTTARAYLAIVSQRRVVEVNLRAKSPRRNNMVKYD